MNANERSYCSGCGRACQDNDEYRMSLLCQVCLNGRPYESPHGIEQSRRDFMRDYPDLYAYIAARESYKALGGAGDRISGYHEAANLVWGLAAAQRTRFEGMQTVEKGSQP